MATSTIASICPAAHFSRLASSSKAAPSGRSFAEVASAPSLSAIFISHSSSQNSGRHRGRVSCSVTQQEEGKETSSKDASSADEVTRKYGLEAGLWKIFTSKDEKREGAGEKKTSQAKELLARYGGAYLATSITLSLISFGLCYVLINAGVDVAALLQKVGIQTDATGEKVGTIALAYAAHKAASPIRFPPTVALTPIVAGWLGKKATDKQQEDKDA